MFVYFMGQSYLTAVYNVTLKNNYPQCSPRRQRICAIADSDFKFELSLIKLKQVCTFHLMYL